MCEGHCVRKRCTSFHLNLQRGHALTFAIQRHRFVSSGDLFPAIQTPEILHPLGFVFLSGYLPLVFELFLILSRFSFSFCSRWHRSARKAHKRSAPSLSSLSKVALETVAKSAWLNIDRSRPRRVECRPLPFTTLLSFQEGYCNTMSL